MIFGHTVTNTYYSSDEKHNDNGIGVLLALSDFS
jgi:hypothetical protein